MHATVYLHPLRTIAMHWETTDGVHALVGYEETVALDLTKSLPTALRTTLCAQSDTLTVIVHTNAVRYHNFPVDEDEEVTERLAFELEEFLPEADRTHDAIRVLPHGGLAYQSGWISIIDVPSSTRDLILAGLGADANVTTDIECDLQWAQREGACIAAGIRGLTLWVATIHGPTAPYHLERIPLTQEADLNVALVDAIAEHTATLSEQWDSICVFGDAIRPEVIEHIKRSEVGRNRTVRRGNAFHHVRARVTPDQQKSVLNRAHVLSAMVGSLMI